jgi:hypothetical protein
VNTTLNQRCQRGNGELHVFFPEWRGRVSS